MKDKMDKHLLDILSAALSNRNITVRFSGIKNTSFDKLVENECFHAVLRIKEILDSSLSDKDCVLAVHKFIGVLEKIGFFTTRHDF